MTSTIVTHSKTLESIISRIITDKYRRVFPNFYGHDTYSFITDKEIISISVLDDFEEVTIEEKDSYRSFLRNAANSVIGRILIIARKGNKQHDRLLKELLPNQLMNIRVVHIASSERQANQIEDHVYNFLYGKPDNGFSTKLTAAELRCCIVKCPACGEKLFLPTDIIILDNEKKTIGKVLTKDWSESICALIRLSIPRYQLSVGKLAPLIFYNKRPAFICPECTETINSLKQKVQPLISLNLNTYFNYDDICRIKPITNNML